MAIGRESVKNELLEKLSEELAKEKLKISEQFSLADITFKKVEFFRSEAYQHQNIDRNSYEQSAFGILPDELLVVIYQLLDIKSVLQLALACKALGMIANADSIRAELYKAKHPPVKIELRVQSIPTEFLQRTLLSASPTYHVNQSIIKIPTDFRFFSQSDRVDVLQAGEKGFVMRNGKK